MKKILVVDDDSSVHKLLNHYLARMGHKMFFAETGREGLEMAIEKKPDLIILDIEMPGEMNGIGVLEFIKANKITENIPVVMLTVHNDFRYIKKAIQLDADDYILKPFKVGTLIGKTEALLRREEDSDWKELKPSQKKVLRITLSSMNGIYNWAQCKQGAPPFEDIKFAGEAIVKGIEDDEIDGVLKAIKEYSGETFVHSLRVAIYLMLFVRNLKNDKYRFSPEEIEDFAIGGLIHDLGKVDVPISILHKPDKFSPVEWAEIKKHVEYTEKILKEMPGVKKIPFEIATRHHEKWNGKGYPNGLKGGDIGVPGLMGVIVDAFEALIANRSYKKAMSPKEAIKTMSFWEGHFDDELFQRFKETILGKEEEMEKVEMEKGDLINT